MNASTSEALQHYLNTHSFVSITGTTSVIAVALLLAVLLEREVLRINRPESARRNIVAFATIVVPTAVIFAAIILTRFIKLS